MSLDLLDPNFNPGRNVVTLGKVWSCADRQTTSESRRMEAGTHEGEWTVCSCAVRVASFIGTPSGQPHP